MLTIRLSEYFGGAFPNETEVDHLLALRGYLFMILKQAQDDRDNDRCERIKGWLTCVSNILEVDYRIDLSRKPQSSRGLFGHYLDVVSVHWKALRELSGR